MGVVLCTGDKLARTIVGVAQVVDSYNADNDIKVWSNLKLYSIRYAPLTIEQLATNKVQNSFVIFDISSSKDFEVSKLLMRVRKLNLNLILIIYDKVTEQFQRLRRFADKQYECDYSKETNNITCVINDFVKKKKQVVEVYAPQYFKYIDTRGLGIRSPL
ncbi:hypothetical protein LCGC14_1173720 [marine sediment metagenome]|uniref:Uncharacterized protein n=1 Tax=marine sediment metagenome TaxID=412755 RepID=A0A0F9LU21_9ZZZZ